MQRLRIPPAGSDSPPPGLCRIRASPARHLWHYFFLFWPLVHTLVRGLTVGSPWSSSTPPSLGRGRVTPPPPKSILLPPREHSRRVDICLNWLQCSISGDRQDEAVDMIPHRLSMMTLWTGFKELHSTSDEKIDSNEEEEYTLFLLL